MRRGEHDVFIGTGCGEPQHLIKSMIEDMNLQDIMLYQMLSFTLSRYVDDPSFLRRFQVRLFFISQAMRKAAFEGKIEYIPAYLSQIPELFNSHRIGLDDRKGSFDRHWSLPSLWGKCAALYRDRKAAATGLSRAAR